MNTYSFSFNKAINFRIAMVSLVYLLCAGHAWGLNISNNVYQIGSCDDLFQFSTLVNTPESNEYIHANANAELTQNISCDGKSDYKPIGECSSQNNVYSGAFNGNNHIISDLSFTSSKKNVGLFGCTGPDASITNVILSDISISDQQKDLNLGSIVGSNNGTLEKNSVIGSNLSGGGNQGNTSFAGGLVGINNENGKISDCLLANVSISNVKNISGFIGKDLSGHNIARSVILTSSIQGQAGGHTGSCLPANSTANGFSYCFFSTGNVISTNYKKTTTCDEAGFEQIFDEENICMLNIGTWNSSTETCSNNSSSYWNINNGHLTTSGLNENGIVLSTTGEKVNTTYKVTFDANGGTLSGTTYMYFEENATINAKNINIPTYQGHSFLGWALRNDATEPASSLGTATNETTIYAVWSSTSTTTYTITTENATASPSANDGVYESGTQITLTPIVAEHYHFVKWSDNNTENPRTETVTGNATYKAIIAIDQFTVTFVDDDESTILKEGKSYNYNTAAESIEKPENPTKESTAQFSYTFAEWSPAITAVTEDVTYKATYNSSRVKYTLTWDFDGGTPVGNYTMGSVENSSEITPPSSVSKTGYTFSSWSLESLIMPAEATTITANWTANNYTATFDANGGEYPQGATTSKQVAFDSEITETGITQPTRTGYTFEGWNLSNSATESGSLGSMNSTSGVTIYAVWSSGSFMVTFNANGHGTAPEARNIIYNGKITKPDNPTATGYTFGGWFKEESCINEWDFSTDVVTGTTILYAKWTQITITVTANNQKYTYNGTNQGTAVIADVEGATIQYSTDGGTNWSTNIPQLKNAGTQTIMVKANKTNYAEGTASYTLTIAQKVVEIEWSNTSLTYNGSAQKPTATVTNLESGDECTVTVGGEQSNAGDNLTATVTGLSNSNYKLPSTTPSTTFAIAKATTNTVTVSLDGWTYGDEANDPSVSATFGEETATFSYCKKNTTECGSSMPTAAGTYTVTASVAGTANYAEGSGSEEFTIAQKVVEIEWSNTSLTYNGSAQKPTATVTNLESGDECTVTVGGEQSNAGDNLTATVTGLSNSNYKLPSTTPSTTFAIAKATTNTVTVSLDGWTYGDEANDPSVSATFGEETATFSYCKKNTTECSSSMPTAAGTYTVTASVAGTANYAEGSGSAEFTISTSNSFTVAGPPIAAFTMETPTASPQPQA